MEAVDPFQLHPIFKLVAVKIVWYLSDKDQNATCHTCTYIYEAEGFYLPGPISIIRDKSRINNHPHHKCGIKLIIQFFNSIVKPFKLGNSYVVLLIHFGIKVYSC